LTLFALALAICLLGQLFRSLVVSWRRCGRVCKKKKKLYSNPVTM